MRLLRRALTALTLSLGIGVPTLVAPPATAEPLARPGTTTPSLSNAELARTLAHIAAAGRGRVGLRPMGMSNRGRPLWLATVGSGPIRLLYITQQHGNEPLCTESAVRALRTIGLSDAGWARALRSRVTLGIAVRANPDGHDRGWRYNDAPHADPEYGEPGMGYDVNRYHDPALKPSDNPVPEAAALQRLWMTYRPAIVVDYHMQGRYRLPDGRESTTSVAWPTAPAVPDAAVTSAKQATVAVHEAFAAAGAVVSRYPGDSYAGIARNAYGIRGSASVLVELSAIPGFEEFQIASAYRSMLTLAAMAGSGALAEIDPARADAIPPRGPEIPDAGTVNLVERAAA